MCGSCRKSVKRTSQQASAQQSQLEALRRAAVETKKQAPEPKPTPAK